MSQEACWFCGEPVGRDERTKEHLVPKSRGGGNHRKNLAVAHLECNRMAGDWILPLKRILRGFLREHGRVGLAALKGKGRSGWRLQAEESLGRWNESRRKKGSG